MFVSAEYCNIPVNQKIFINKFPCPSCKPCRATSCTCSNQRFQLALQFCIVCKKMLQVIVSYLENRFACFFLDKPITLYEDLVDKIKDVIPYIRDIPSERIRVAYKDINLSTARDDDGVFISIAPEDSLILNEAFRNAYDCSSESFKRVHIKVREIDSPFIAKNRRGVEENSISIDERVAASAGLQTVPRVDLASRKKLGFKSVESIQACLSRARLEKVQEKDITTQLEERQDELYAVESQLDELNRPIVQPSQLGQYKTIVCGNCHVRGHRAEGNKNNAPCARQPCYSYVSCGQSKKHPKHFEEIRTLTKRRKQLKSDIDILSKDRENLAAFESKSISAFTTAVTNRLLKAFPDRYDPRTAIEKIKLPKDIANIRLVCNGKIPNFSSVNDDRNLFLDLLKEQQNRFDEIEHMDERACRANASSTSTNISPNFTNVNKISSPIKVKKCTKNRRRKYSSSSSSSDSDSTSSSSGSDIRGRKKDECKSRRRHRSTKTKKHKSRMSRGRNSPEIEQFEEVATYKYSPRRSTLDTNKGKESLPTHSHTKTQMEVDNLNAVNEANVDSYTTPSSEAVETSENDNSGWSLEYLAYVAENAVKLLTN